MNYILKLNIYSILLAALVLGTAACSNEPTLPAPSGTIGIDLKGGMQFFVSSRAEEEEPEEETTPDPLEAEDPLTIGVYGVMNNASNPVFNNQKFYNATNQEGLLRHPDFAGSTTVPTYITSWPTNHNNNPWAYDPVQHWTTSRKYQFYAYSPWSENSNMQINSLAYDGMKSLVWRNLPPFSQYDYVVAEGIVECESGVMPHFNMKHHVTARICFSFMIEPNYHLQRDIKITKVEVDQNQVGLTYTDCTIDLSKTEAGFTLSTGNEYKVPENSVMELLPEYPTSNGTHTGLTLNSTTYSLYSSVYAIPQSIESLTTTVTYNVYDKEGTLTRENQKVKNIIPIKTTLVSGQYYSINILIDPDFLYVLSDHDINPDVIIHSNQ